MSAITQLERNKAILRKYIPEKSVTLIAEWIYKYNFKLKIKKPRISKHGDYMPPHKWRNHTITINKDLNKYSFLITLVHEIAHLITWEKYRGKVYAHGREWKSEYCKLLNYFLSMNSTLPNNEKIFPPDVHLALKEHATSPAATTCSDIRLARILDKYDDGILLTLEKIPFGSQFRIMFSNTKHSNDIYIKGKKKRTRFECLRLGDKKKFLIHALCKVVLT